MTHRGLLHHLIIVVTNVSRSSPFYGPMLRYFGYGLGENSKTHENWKRWDLNTPHEISIVQANPGLSAIKHIKGAVGHHHHLAFCALDKKDVDDFHANILVRLEKKGLCTIENPPCECPEYGKGYYATFFKDPDNLKYEFVINPNFLKLKSQHSKPVRNKIVRATSISVG